MDQNRVFVLTAQESQFKVIIGEQQIMLTIYRLKYRCQGAIRNWLHVKAGTTLLFLCLFFLFLFQSCDGGSSGGSTSDDISSQEFFAPAESVHQTAYYSYETAPEGFTAVVGWMQAIDIEGMGEPSQVEVDWMRVYATVDNTDTILLEDTFDSHTPAMDYYGLYSRDPWFVGDVLGDMPFTVENGTLVLEPDTNPDAVYHWWNTTRSIVPEDADRIWFEARVRIIGGAGVQAGIDYWKDLYAEYAGYNVNNTEAGVSDWFGNITDDWQIISVGRR